MSESTLTPPEVSYDPPAPDDYDPKIGLIGCGGITESHLEAYRKAGYDVVALCDLVEERARERRDEFYPDGDVYTDHRAVLERDDVEVVDIATHPEARPPLIEDAIRSGTHVLSQKPFVLDLEVGERLIELAENEGVRLAVNQNGRWAPHWSYCREAVQEGIVGEIMSTHLQVHWDHDWIRGTSFEGIDHAILYDFAIHWFDFLATVFQDRDPRRVYAATALSPVQESRPPLMGEAIVEYEEAQASLIFDGNTQHGVCDRTTITGTDATLLSEGPDLNDQSVTVYTDGEEVTPDLEGSWFPQGFEGTMGELLSAIEADREPSHAARDNLRSLELCFAAIAAAEDGTPKTPGEVRELPGPQ